MLRPVVCVAGGRNDAMCRKSKAKSSVSDSLLGGHQGVTSSLSTALNYAKDKGLFNEVTKGRTSDRYSEWKEGDVTTGVASVDTIFQKYRHTLIHRHGRFAYRIGSNT